MDEYININKIAELKGLKSTRAIRLAINQGKYIAREVEVRGGKSYEILYSSLEPEIQDRLDEEKLKTTSIVPFENKVNFVSENAKLTALARVDIVVALNNLRKKYPTKKEADSVFLDLYNSGMYLPQIYKFVGSISIGTLHRWVKTFENYGTDGLLQKRKTNQQGEYNTILNEEMKQIFLKYLLHPNKFSIGKAINLTKHILEKRGYENIPCNLTFRRFAENFKKNNYSKWILFREGEKAYHDKIEPYIERDISKIEVGDVLIADGHVLNFQIINPFTGKPTRATLVGFLDWKSTALAMKDTTYSNFIQKRIPRFRLHILQAIKQAKEFLRTYPHIACFSETPSSPPMWAHYADSHKGFVLEYEFQDYFTPCLNCKNECVFRHYELLYPVIYTKTRFNAKDFFSSYWSQIILMNAPVKVFIPKDDDLAIYKVLIHKSKDWEYEKEWRIISHCEAYPMIKQRPTAIYLGAKMKNANKNYLIKIARKLKIKTYIMDIDITNTEYKMTPKECKSYRV